MHLKLERFLFHTGNYPKDFMTQEVFVDVVYELPA